MKIQGIGNQQAQPVGKAPVLGSDSRIQAYQQQIAQLQQKLQDLAQNDELTMEEKMKKRQEINQQIHTAEQQMRQVQREIREEQNKAKKDSFDEMVSAPKKKGADSMSSNKMRSIIAGDQAMKQADGNMQLATEMEGKARVLAGEIATDQQRGVDTTKKEEELAGVEERTDLLKADAIKVAAEAADEIQETSDEERTEKKDPSGEDSKNQDAQQTVTENVQTHVDVRL